MMDERNQQRLARRKICQEYPQLFVTVLVALYRHDPIGITVHEKGTTEYAPEVKTILPRLKEAKSEGDLRQILYEESVWWFGPAVFARRQIASAEPAVPGWRFAVYELWS